MREAGGSSMFRIELIFVWICLVNSLGSGRYIEHFFETKPHRTLSRNVWCALYFVSQILITGLADIVKIPLAGTVVRIVLQIAVLLLMQAFFFCGHSAADSGRKNRNKQVFAAVSFAAGTEIIKYMLVLSFHILGDAAGTGLLKLVDSGIIDTLGKVEWWSGVLEGVMTCAGVVIYAAVLALYLKIIIISYVQKDDPLGTYDHIFLLLPSVGTLCIAVTLSGMMRTVDFYDVVPATRFWIPVICFFLLGMIVSSVIVFQKLLRLSAEEKRRVLLENQVRQIQSEVSEIQEIYADMRGLRHDMRSHLANITAFVRTTSGSDGRVLSDYIGKMERTISRLDFPCQTGNPITDIIMHQKSRQAAKRQIAFTADFTYPAEQRIDAYDMAIILNNALENAIAACEKVDGTREICLHAYRKGSLFFIEICNDFSGGITIDSSTGLPVSTRQDRQHHGIGLSNILRCARKYMGDIDISVMENEGRKRFLLVVMLNTNVSHPK